MDGVTFLLAMFAALLTIGLVRATLAARPRSPPATR